MGAISAWSINVQDDLKDTKPVFEIQAGIFVLRGFNVRESFWVVCRWPLGGEVAFRVAFAQSSHFTNLTVKSEESAVQIKMKSDLGNYKVILRIYDDAMFHYTTSFKPKAPLLIPFWPRDIVPLTRTGKIENSTGTIHTHQIGSRTGQLYFSIDKPQTGSVFYFQNLTSLSDFCEATQTSAAETVGGAWPEIGYQLPLAKEKPLPPNWFVISDAYVIPADSSPKNAFDISQQYLDYLARIYLKLPKPATLYRDWPEISIRGLEDLMHNKGCWMFAGGHSYLNAYLCDYKTPPEIMVQLAVLDSLVGYANWAGESFTVIDDIKSGLPAFYDDKLKTVCRWLPSLRDNLDHSEEQKEPLVMDSWYLHHPMMNLAKLAIAGDKQAEQLVMDSIDFVINVAHTFDYEWPVFYKMDTLEIIKAETSEGQGGEKDVGGGYALLMLNVWELTNDKKYFNEAKKAIKKLPSFGMDVFYQANTTAFGALAALRIFKETKDELYLDISYLCIAGIFRNVQLWESEYGDSRYFPDFFGIFPLNDAPYRAAYEAMEVFATLNDYIKDAFAANIKTLPSLKILIPELIRYAMHRLPYYYPPMLPKDILSDEVKTGEIDSTLWIPLEDLYDGWDKNGQVGQEVYGAGVGFGVAPRQYVKIAKAGFMLYTDYPIDNLTIKGKSISFQIIGDERLTCRLLVIPADPSVEISVSLFGKNKKQEPLIAVKTKKYIEYEVSGNATLTLQYS